MNHAPPSWVRPGAMFFITICCKKRIVNQLCLPEVAKILFNAAHHYHKQQDWYLKLLLLMPDHLHALMVNAPDKKLAELVGSWKRFVSIKTGVIWQKNFFDHRLRSEDSWEEKAAYIRANPVRAGLIQENQTWPYMIQY